MYCSKLFATSLHVDKPADLLFVYMFHAPLGPNYTTKYTLYSIHALLDS